MFASGVCLLTGIVYMHELDRPLIGHYSLYEAKPYDLVEAVLIASANNSVGNMQCGAVLRKRIRLHTFQACITNPTVVCRF